MDEDAEDVDDPMNKLDSKPEGLGLQPKKKAKRRYMPKRQAGRIEAGPVGPSIVHAEAEGKGDCKGQQQHVDSQGRYRLAGALLGR